jgi:hypothetical protein
MRRGTRNSCTASLFLVLLFTLTACERSPSDVCSAVLGSEPQLLLELEIGIPVALGAVPTGCAPAGLAWEVSEPAVAQIVPAGARAASLLPIAPGSGVLSVRDAASALVLLADVPYRVLAPDLPTPPRDTTALLQTDRVAYLMATTEHAWRTEVHVTFSNRLSPPVTLLPCFGLRAAELQKLVGSEWTPAYLWMLPLLPCFEPGERVEAGGTSDVSLEIRAGYPWGPVGFPYVFLTSGVAGTYRLVWGPAVLRMGEGTGESLPDHQRVSNPFIISVLAASDR